MTIQVSGVAATNAQVHALRNDVIGARVRRGLGDSLFNFKYTGVAFSFLLAADGGPTAASFGTVPSDAVGIEVFANSAGANDWLFFLPRASMTSGGSLGANLTAHQLECFGVTAGAPMVVPFTAQGVASATTRWGGNTASMRCTGRFIAASSQYPYLLGSVANAVTETVLIGDGATTGTRQLPFGDTNRFPAATTAVQIQVLGLPIFITTDGAIPTAATGVMVQPGRYVLDLAEQGVALSALKMFIPTGAVVLAMSLVPGV